MFEGNLFFKIKFGKIEDLCWKNVCKLSTLSASYLVAVNQKTLIMQLNIFSPQHANYLPTIERLPHIITIGYSVNMRSHGLTTRSPY